MIKKQREKRITKEARSGKRIRNGCGRVQFMEHRRLSIPGDRAQSPIQP